MAKVRSRVEITGSPKLPVAHGRPKDRAKNGHSKRKTKGLVLNEEYLIKLHIFLYFSVGLWYNKPAESCIFRRIFHGRSR
jgi:hypothetical protein